MVISYLRVSTENQKNDGTIEIQKDEIKKFAKDNNIEIDCFFMDNGISGAKDLDERQGLADMLEYIDTNKVDSLIIYKLDRLVRDIGLQEYILRQLTKKGVKLISLNDKDIDGDPQRKLFRVMLGAIADYERSMIDLRMSAGRRRKARQGKYAGGSVPLGYKVKDSNLVIDNDSSTIVKRIFKMKRHKRYSMNKIANTLNDENIPTSKGGKWYASTIKAILNNKTYTKGILNYKGIASYNHDLRLI